MNYWLCLINKMRFIIGFLYLNDLYLVCIHFFYKYLSDFYLSKFSGLLAPKPRQQKPFPLQLPAMKPYPLQQPAMFQPQPYQQISLVWRFPNLPLCHPARPSRSRRKRLASTCTSSRWTRWASRLCSRSDSASPSGTTRPACFRSCSRRCTRTPASAGGWPSWCPRWWSARSSCPSGSLRVAPPSTTRTPCRR